MTSCFIYSHSLLSSPFTPPIFLKQIHFIIFHPQYFQYSALCFFFLMSITTDHYETFIFTFFLKNIFFSIVGHHRSWIQFSVLHSRTLFICSLYKSLKLLTPASLPPAPSPLGTTNLCVSDFVSWIGSFCHISDST